MSYTVTYFDDTTRRRVVQTWTEKADAATYARSLRQIFSKVKVELASAVQNLPLSTEA